MKKILTILFCLPIISFGQISCSLLDITDVIFDYTDMTITIQIYDSNSTGMQYPFVAYTLDATGDTIHNGNINLFGTMGLDTVEYTYSLLNNTNPFYPLSIYFVHTSFTGSNTGQDTCILSYHPSCDSVIANFNQIDSSSLPHLLYLEIETLDISNNGSFGYCGFILLDELLDTIAYENINIAGNVFGLMPYNTENRVLELTQSINIPFSGYLHLVNGWFAGNAVTSCVYALNINNNPTIINEVNKENNLLKITDLLGREIKNKNKPHFYIYDDGTVEKRIVIE